MIDSRKLAQEVFNAFSARLQPFIGSIVHVSFGPHAFDTLFTHVCVATQAQLYHKPSKRVHGDKSYTPYVCTLETNSGETLSFVMEDARVSFATNAVLIRVGDCDIKIAL